MRERLIHAGVSVDRANWMLARSRQGAVISFQPTTPVTAIQAWLGDRLWWWPTGIPNARCLGVISSHLGKSLEQRREWFDALRTLALRCDSSTVLVSVPQTTTCSFVDRAAELFGLDRLRVEIGKQESIQEWARQLPEQTSGSPQLWISPQLDDAAECDAVKGMPLQDRVAMALSDELRVLYIRAKGRLDSLLRTRLADAAWLPQSVRIACGDGLVEGPQVDDFQQLGAILWYLHRSDQEISGETEDPPEHEVPILKSSDVDAWNYLTHCTRGRQGPWPKQTEEDYLDDLLLDRAGADHSCLAALCRILNQQRLVASNAAIRGGYETVSFTEANPEELLRLRSYKKHRGRWDFEPYGIAIRIDRLREMGIQSVQYGSESDWDNLPNERRPYFQLNREVEGFDWSIEREWRCVGDVDLSQLGEADAMVLVPTHAEAFAIGRVSRWPILVLESS
ncbi:MAG: hypothetical protein CMJ78_27445 [Planctomycetaceae bacterium]|nr:hypothetical protein [Planctomycetaceae bacterium]